MNHQQLSLLDYERRAAPGLDDPSLVSSISARLIAELDENPPVSLEVVASARGIGDIRVEPMPNPASLTPEPGGLIMRLRAGDSHGRQRFGGFHEVGHTFQPGYMDVRSLRCDEVGRVPRQASDPEALSDVAAAELLLPQAHFEADLSEGEFSFESILALADLYQASVQATTYRAGSLWPEPTLVISLEPGLRKSERDDPEAEARLRVVSAWAADGRWPFVPKNKSAAADGALCRALAGEEINGPGSLSELDVNGPPNLTLIAKRFRYRTHEGERRDRVLALFRQRTRD